MIPLCSSCHNRFDKPRTREEYEKLAKVKRSLIERALQHEIFSAYPLESEIGRIISGLYQIQFDVNGTADLELDVKSLDDKFNDSLLVPVQRKIRHAVTDYYHHIRREFRELELLTPAISQLILSQVRAYYLKQKSLGLSQSAVFNNVVAWLVTKTSPDMLEAAEIVASFFVQNCEVFD